MTALLPFPEPASRHDQMRECFDKFHHDNPAIYELFCRFTDDLIRRGRKRYSADAVVHRVRWHVNIETAHEGCSEGDRFKINDHHVAFYARLWLDDHPEHEGFFRVKPLPSAEREAR